MSDDKHDGNVVDMFRYRMDKGDYSWIADDDEDEEPYQVAIEQLGRDFQRWFGFPRADDMHYSMMAEYRRVNDEVVNPKFLKNPVDILSKEEAGYIEAKLIVARYYKQNGLYADALKVYLEIYRRAKEDEWEIALEILSMYIVLYRYDDAKAFFDALSIKRRFAGMCLMSLASVIANDMEAADYYFAQILKANSEFAIWLTQENFPLGEVMVAHSSFDSYEELFGEVDRSTLSPFSRIFGEVLPVLLSSASYYQSYFLYYQKHKVEDRKE